MSSPTPTSESLVLVHFVEIDRPGIYYKCELWLPRSATTQERNLRTQDGASRATTATGLRTGTENPDAPVVDAPMTPGASQEGRRIPDSPPQVIEEDEPVFVVDDGAQDNAMEMVGSSRRISVHLPPSSR